MATRFFVCPTLQPHNYVKRSHSDRNLVARLASPTRQRSLWGFLILA
jgi:hypothetical protein